MELVTIAEAAQRLGVSQDTVKRKLRRGELKGQREPRPQGFTWMIELDLEASENGTHATTGASTGENTNASMGAVQSWETLVAALQAQIAQQQEQLAVKDRQIETKDRQIGELHVLVQQAQAALPAPRASSRPWWRFWGR